MPLSIKPITPCCKKHLQRVHYSTTHETRHDKRCFKCKKWWKLIVKPTGTMCWKEKTE